MAATAELTLEGRAIVVTELTVSDVRDWIKSIEDGTLPVDPAGSAVFEDVGLIDMALMSDAPAPWLATLAPSQLQPLADLCKKVNPHFFRCRAVVQAAHIAHVRALINGASAARSNETPSA